MDYYGFRDEEDGTLLNVEAEAESIAINKEIEEWREREALQKSMLSSF